MGARSRGGKVGVGRIHLLVSTKRIGNGFAGRQEDVSVKFFFFWRWEGDGYGRFFSDMYNFSFLFFLRESKRL